MQRAPVFVFADARAGREFTRWVEGHHRLDSPAAPRPLPASPSCIYIDTYLASKFAFLRFNYTTGDAAGQNMVGRATFRGVRLDSGTDQDAAIAHFYLESNFATDKKASQVNIMRTRGKRVTAEVIIKRDVLIADHARRAGKPALPFMRVANIGAFLSGANNNGLHSANAITAMFIATGQDVANVAESSAGMLYAELTPRRPVSLDHHPFSDCRTYGGGTSLPTQRECLEILDC